MFRLKNVSIAILEPEENLGTQIRYMIEDVILQRTKSNTLKVIKDKTGKFFKFGRK